jgi:hypothetical protein
MVRSDLETEERSEENQAQPGSPYDGFGAALSAQFAQDGIDVKFDSVFTDA